MVVDILLFGGVCTNKNPFVYFQRMGKGGV